MTHLVRLATPRAIRDDRGDRRWATHASAAVVHVGQSALVLTIGVPHHLVVITASSSGTMPGGICIPDRKEFERTRAAVQQARLAKRDVDLTNWSRSSTAVEHVDLRLGRQGIDRAAILRLQDQLAGTSSGPAKPPLMDPRPIRLRADQLVLALRRRNGLDVTTMLERLVGAGPGTTPTGDDIIVGALAGLCLTGETKEFSILATTLPAFLARTTTAAGHYLKAASTGRFGTHIHELAQALTGARSTTEAFRTAAGWGSTSGLDVLTGLIAAASPGRPEPINHGRLNQSWQEGLAQTA